MPSKKNTESGIYLSGPALDRTVVVGVVVFFSIFFYFEHFLEEEGAIKVRGFAVLRVLGHPRVVALLQEPHVHVDGLIEQPPAAHPTYVCRKRQVRSCTCEVRKGGGGSSRRAWLS